MFVSLSDDKPKNRVEAILNRERKKAAFGNLTLVHYGVNRSVQHGPFDKKREVLFKEPNLHLNRCSRTSGIKTNIDDCGRKLFEVAQRVWKGPG